MPHSTRHQLELIIDSRLEEVTLVSVTIRALCKHFECSDQVSWPVDLCVAEMLNNIVEHGLGFEAGHQIKISLIFTKDKLAIQIHDRAKPMPQKAPADIDFDPNDPATLPERGYGLFLTHELMDEVSYQSDENGNHLTLVKLLGE